MHGATPRPAQGEGYYVGAQVEVWSKTWDKWFAGRVTHFEGSNIVAEFVAADGKEKEKRIPIGHEQIRLLGKPSQAKPVSAVIADTSPVYVSGPSAILPPPAVVAQRNRGYSDPGSVASIKYPEGKAVEYLARSDNRWYRGVVSNFSGVGAGGPCGGCYVMLDIGTLKQVQPQDIPTRLRTAGAPKAVVGALLPGCANVIERSA
jgi:hypothetical protein